MSRLQSRKKVGEWNSQHYLEYFKQRAGRSRGSKSPSVRQISRADHDILFRMSWYFFRIAREPDAPVREHWDLRRNCAKNLLKVSAQMVRLIDHVVHESAWIESRYEVTGLATLNPEAGGTTYDRCIRGLSSVRDLISAMTLPLTYLAAARKPRVDDIQNCIVYIMFAYLKSASHCSSAEIYRLVTDEINAIRYATNHEDLGLDQSNIGLRVRRFRKIYKSLAKGIDDDPLAFSRHFPAKSTK